MSVRFDIVIKKVKSYPLENISSSLLIYFHIMTLVGVFPLGPIVYNELNYNIVGT